MCHLLLRTGIWRQSSGTLVILIFGGLQLTQAFRLGPFFTAGQTQFFVLKWLGFLFACSAGVFLTGPVRLLSNVNLHIAEGATLKFDPDPKKYLPLVLTR